MVCADAHEIYDFSPIYIVAVKLTRKLETNYTELLYLAQNLIYDYFPFCKRIIWKTLWLTTLVLMHVHQSWQVLTGVPTKEHF